MERDRTPTSPNEVIADERLEAAITGAQESGAILRNWQSVLREFRGMYEENGFGRDMKKIMMMSVRES